MIETRPIYGLPVGSVITLGLSGTSVSSLTGVEVRIVEHTCSYGYHVETPDGRRPYVATSDLCEFDASDPRNRIAATVTRMRFWTANLLANLEHAAKQGQNTSDMRGHLGVINSVQDMLCLPLSAALADAYGDAS